MKPDRNPVLSYAEEERIRGTLAAAARADGLSAPPYIENALVVALRRRNRRSMLLRIAAAGAMAAFPTAGMAVDNLVNQPGVASKVAGVGQAALAASAALPGPWGAAGRMANLGYQAFMNTGLPKKLSNALGMGEPDGAPAPVGYTSNPSPAPPFRKLRRIWHGSGGTRPTP